MDIQEKPSKPSPISSVNFFSKHFLIWFWPIFRLGYVNNLTLNDLFDPASEDEAIRNADELERAWRNRKTELVARRSNANPEQVVFLQNGHVQGAAPRPRSTSQENTLSLALWDVYGSRFLLGLPILIFTDCILRVVQPWFMLKLIRTFIEESRDEAEQYYYAAGVCLSTYLITVTSNPCFFFLNRVSQRCRIALGSLIERKVLRLSTCVLHTDVGAIATLISNDTGTIEKGLMELPYLVTAPLQMLCFLWFVFVEFELGCLAGLGFIFLYLPFQYLIFALSSNYRKGIGQQTDRRSAVLTEVIDAIQTVKMYAWEFVFQGIIHQRRKDEVKELRKRSRLHAFHMSMFLTSSRLVPFLTFTVFLYLGGPLTADRVFYGIAVYNTMTHFMVFCLCGALRSLGEITGSIRRIHTFLDLPEKPLNRDTYTSRVERTPNPNIEFNHVVATWERQHIPALRDLHLNFQANQLIVVVGKVGSGKSSLLQLILNELEITSGNVSVEGQISYAPQNSTKSLFPGSIRANVLNHADFDDGNYLRVLSAACLLDEIKQLEGRDYKRVTGLSGGQKARVNLARALYRDADIYLLDDPLSAVDPGVSRQIFNSAIKDYLRSKLVILVTHQLQYLSEADRVIVMEEGQIIGDGTFAEVRDTVVRVFEGQAEIRVDDMLAPGAGNVAPVNQATAPREAFQIGIDQEEQEEQGVGSLGLRIYWDYFSAGNSTSQLTFYFVIFIVSQVFTTLIEYWLAIWTNAEEVIYERSLKSNLTNLAMNDSSEADHPGFTWQGFEHFVENLHSLEQNHYLYGYIILTIIVFLTNLAKAVAFFHYCMRICTRIHEKMLKSLLRATPAFFDNNAPGRIINRFTKDVGTIDEQIPFAFFDMWTIFLQVGTVILLIIVAIWHSFVPVIVFLLMLAYVRQYYVATSRELKRIDATTRSPVVSHIQATFNALATMRALGVQTNLSRQFDCLQNLNTCATISFSAATQCFNIWIEILATVLLTFVAFGFLLAQNYLGMTFLGGNVGLAICSAMSLTIWLQYGMKVSANVENLMVSVERALQYTNLPSEAALETTGRNLPDNWPGTGSISFENITLSYNNDINILSDLSFDIDSGMNIGIVGQTGAGKSSVLRALFRMTELREGKILLDGENLQGLGLHQIRKAMAIIPQEPKLFKGSLRFNLDPRTVQPDESYISDSQMRSILNTVGLEDKDLDFQIGNQGVGLSEGERQLVSIGRALLLDRKIVCLDEATANTDQGTDRSIQETLRTRLAKSTTITIAHRLGTVIECDRILVLHAGRMQEYDNPHELLRNPNGRLTQMVNQTGNDIAPDLIRRSCRAWKQRTGNIHCDVHENNDAPNGSM